MQISYINIFIFKDAEYYNKNNLKYILNIYIYIFEIVYKI